jgi:hypothetical protein
VRQLESEGVLSLKGAVGNSMSCRVHLPGGPTARGAAGIAPGGAATGGPRSFGRGGRGGLLRSQVLQVQQQASNGPRGAGAGMREGEAAGAPAPWPKCSR